MKDDIKNLKFLSDRRFLKKSNTTNTTNTTNKNDNSQYVVKNSLYIKNNIIIFVLSYYFLTNIY